MVRLQHGSQFLVILNFNAKSNLEENAIFQENLMIFNEVMSVARCDMDLMHYAYVAYTSFSHFQQVWVEESRENFNLPVPLSNQSFGQSFKLGSMRFTPI